MNKGVGTADQWESQSRGFVVRVRSNLCICSPGVVELVRSNLAPDFPLIHGRRPLHSGCGDTITPEF